MHRFFRIPGITLLVAYVGLCLIITLGQNKMLYQPFPGPLTPQEAGLQEFERHYLTTTDGQQLPYWEHESDGPIILYFHGNGGGLYAFSSAFDYLAKHHFHVIAMEYRGFPGAPGPSYEPAIVGDAATLFQHVRKQYPDHSIVIWGYSLGSGVATELAAEDHPAGLVLEAPFSAAVDRAAEIFPLFPVRWLMRDQYHSIDVIDKVHAPLFIMHGENDEIVPIHLGERLFDKAAPPKTFRRYPHATHMTLMKFGAYDDAVAFIHSLPLH